MRIPQYFERQRLRQTRDNPALESSLLIMKVA
jgi:hypothetical protein